MLICQQTVTSRVAQSCYVFT